MLTCAKMLLMKTHKLHLAGCVILDERGRVLLLHRRATIRDQWETPGGKIEDGENPRTAADREVEEEIGVKVMIIKRLGHKDFVEDDFVMGYTWYLAQIMSGDLKILEKDTFDGLRYFSWSELDEMKDKLSANTHNLVEAYISGEIKL